MWTELTSNEEIGGSAITSYNLQMYDDVGEEWTDLVGHASDYLLTEFTLTNEVQPG